VIKRTRTRARHYGVHSDNELARATVLHTGNEASHQTSCDQAVLELCAYIGKTSKLNNR